MNAPMSALMSESMNACMIEQSSGHRQAAVALHALGPIDRELVLAELADTDRQVLCACLNELDALGFGPADSAAANALARPDSDPLAAARGADVHRLLQHEPAALVAQVLSLQAWRWRADYLALQSPARLDQLRAAAPAGAVAPARAAFLSDAVRTRLSAQPSRAVLAAPRASGRRLPLLQRLRKLVWTR